MKRHLFTFALAILCAKDSIGQGYLASLIGKPCPTTIFSVIKDDQQRGSRSGANKFVIVDFFASSCVACFTSLAHMNELQQKFADRFSFVLIGREDAKIATVYERFKKKYNVNLPVYYDSALFNKMELDAVPKYVWIDDQNIVRDVTSVEKVTEANLQSFLNRRQYFVPATPKATIPFDLKKPFLVNGNGDADSNYLYRSVLSMWKPNVRMTHPPSIDFLEAKGTFQVLGADLSSLYNYAYAGANGWGSNSPLYGHCYRVPLLRLRDSATFRSNRTTGENRFCYSVSVPLLKANKQDLQAIMQADLQKYFGYRVTVEMHEMPYWSLTVSKLGKKKLTTKGETGKSNYSHVGFSYKNIPVSRVIDILYYKFQDGPPFVDETGIKSNIDISVDAILSDFNDFRNALKKAGLNLSKRKKPMRVIVIRDKTDS